MLFFKTQISQNRKSGDKKHSAGSNLCFICPKIMKFYSNLYFIILKNLCMPNMSYLRFFIFVGWKRVNWDYPLMPRFSKKGVLCWKVFWWKPVEKNVLCYLAQPPGKPLIGPRPKNTFFAHHISLDYFVKNLSMYLYDFFRYVTFYEKWHFSWIAPYYHLKKLNVLKTLSFSFMP